MPHARTQIRASAGSGKTYRITMDFLNLLATAGERESGGCVMSRAEEGYGWQEIMAVTFTNAAAAEMRKRVVDTLKLIALGNARHDTISQRDALRWVERILERFSALNIRTIDSLLHTVVRLGALELDLPPDFEPVFDNNEALTPLLDSLMESTRDHPGFAALLEQACRELVFLDPNFKGFQAGDRVREVVLSLVPVLCRYETEPRFLSAEELSESHTQLVTEVVQAATTLQALLSAEKLAVNHHFKNAVEKCTALPPRAKAVDSKMLRDAPLDEGLNKASKGCASPVACATWEKLMFAHNRLNTHGALLLSAMRLAPFLSLARVLAAALPAHLSDEGRVPQEFIPRLASRVLAGEHGGISGISGTLCRMGAALTHILIDEFQDTSRDQWAAIQPLALEALSRGGSLTWVGDVKQAIYGWRGGDATLFDEVSDDAVLCGVAPQVNREQLPFNRRSLSEVILYNNAAFARLAEPEHAEQVLRCLLPKDTPPHVLTENVRLLAQAFTGAEQDVPAGRQGGYVRVLGLPIAANKGELEELVGTAFTDLMEEILVRRRAGEVAVLTRSNAQVSEVARLLMDMGVRVVTENSFLLAEHPLVRELIALLTFLDTPEDDIAFLGFILGTELFLPVSGLGEAFIHRWLPTTALAGKNRDPLSTLFRRTFPAEWNAWIEPFFGAAGLLTAYDTLREAMEHFGVAQRLPGQAVFAQRLLEVCHTAETEGHASVSRFLEFWNTSAQDEKAPMPAGMDAVRVMTVHKSKGRQFPVVVCPWLNLTPGDPKAPEIVELEGYSAAGSESPHHVLAYPVSALDSFHAAKAENAREALHRLYVAWTRAEEELYVFATATQKDANAVAALDILLDTEFSVADDMNTLSVERGTPGTASQEATPVPQPQPTPVAPVEPETPEAAEPWRPLGWMPKLRIFRSPLEDLAYTPRRRGIFVHHCLEYLQSTGNPAQDAERAVLEGLASFPVPIREPELARADLVDRLTWYAGLPETAHWIRHGSPERTILDEKGGFCRADLLVDDGHTLTVVDYKTGVPQPKDVAQVQKYMALLNATQPLPVRGRLVYMDLSEVRDVTPVRH